MRPMPGAPLRRSACGFAVATVSGLLLAVGCGGTAKEDPTPEDIDVVAAAVSDIVYQCGSYTAGHVAAPDAQALERDVDTLLEAYDRLEPDTSFQVGADAGIPRRTSLRKELRFGARILNEDCLPEQAERLSEAAD
jgi:hypothetical protein